MKAIFTLLRARLAAGILVTVPVILTVLALRFLLRTFDGLLGPTMASLVGRQVPGLGALATVLMVLFVGILASNYVGRRVVGAAEGLVGEIPLVRSIHRASKDIIESLTGSRRQGLREVVLLEYPNRSLYAYGFVTGYTTHPGPDGPVRLANVFLPGPPVPTTGLLVAVPVSDLLYLDMSVENALKLVLSAGMVCPPALHARAKG